MFTITFTNPEVSIVQNYKAARAAAGTLILEKAESFWGTMDDYRPIIRKAWMTAAGSPKSRTTDYWDAENAFNSAWAWAMTNAEPRKRAVKSPARKQFKTRAGKWVAANVKNESQRDAMVTMLQGLEF